MILPKSSQVCVRLGRVVGKKKQQASIKSIFGGGFWVEIKTLNTFRGKKTIKKLTFPGTKRFGMNTLVCAGAATSCTFSFE